MNRYHKDVYFSQEHAEHLQRRIKEVINRIQLLTESAEDKKTREVLMFSLRELQREYQKFI